LGATELEPAPVASRAAFASLEGDGGSVRPLKETFTLRPASPNPFNPRTELAFTLDRGTRIDLSIYDVRGQLVRTLRSENYPAGSYRVMWDGTSNAGSKVASGMYFARLSSEGRTMVQRLTLIK